MSKQTLHEDFLSKLNIDKERDDEIKEIMRGIITEHISDDGDIDGADLINRIITHTGLSEIEKLYGMYQCTKMLYS